MIAAWDVFGNTGNLKIAVASVDEGYESDLVPVKINVGEQVISSLRANDQIKWVFTDKEDAIDGAKSGKYYAAVVIPERFSRDMMTFYSDDAKHAKIIYYSNEKKNAISPKVTDQGADAISVQVNQAFAKTLSDTALSLAQGLVTYADNADVDGHIGELANHVGWLSRLRWPRLLRCCARIPRCLRPRKTSLRVLRASCLRRRVQQKKSLAR